MARFFASFAIICTLALAASLVAGMGGWFGPAGHMLLGLGSALLAACLHCLVFAIFTGSGKDTRLLVQDLALNQQYVARTKAFKREVFPPALYAIGWLFATTTAGGAIAAWPGSPVARYFHLFLAWFTFFYNVRTFWREALAVAENSRILVEVNRVAGDAVWKARREHGSAPTDADPASELAFETHAYALGKFLCFLGLNVWLVYLYFRVIMGWIGVPLWPFLALSAAFLAGGYYLRWRYRGFRPLAPPAESLPV